MRRRWMLLGVIIPLLVGMMIYYLFFPEVIFVKTIDRLLGISFHVPLKTQIIYFRDIKNSNEIVEYRGAKNFNINLSFS